MIVGYINSNKKNVEAEAQRQAINDYAQANGLIIDAFYTYDNVSQLAESFQTGGHTVLFANIVSLGGTLAQVKDNLRLLLAKGLKMLLQGLEQAAEIMSSMISVASKRALADKKEQGYKLGRKTGYRNQKYIWSGKEEEIKRKLLSGVTRRQVAKDTGMSIFSLYNYINQTPEIKQILRSKNNA